MRINILSVKKFVGKMAKNYDENFLKTYTCEGPDEDHVRMTVTVKKVRCGIRRRNSFGSGSVDVKYPYF